MTISKKKVGKIYAFNLKTKEEYSLDKLVDILTCEFGYDEQRVREPWRGQGGSLTLSFKGEPILRIKVPSTKDLAPLTQLCGCLIDRSFFSSGNFEETVRANYATIREFFSLSRLESLPVVREHVVKYLITGERTL